MSRNLDTCQLAVDIQAAIFAALRGGLVGPSNVPRMDDLVNEFVDQAASRIDGLAKEIVMCN